MRNLKIILEYQGTNYHGFQRQTNGLTIQEVLEDKLTILTKESIVVYSSGRTDAGVHAYGQVVNFLTSSTISCNKLALGLNSLLPEDIAIKSVQEMPLEFHARYSSVSKVYCYNIWNSSLHSALLRDFVYFFPRKLDVEKMREGAKYLLGEHDFSAFCSINSSARSYVRNVKLLEIREKEESLLEIEIEANGFLYNMVRIIVGTLIEVGLNKISPLKVKDILASGNRCEAGNTAPAKGLFLKEVKY